MVLDTTPHTARHFSVMDVVTAVSLKQCARRLPEHVKSWLGMVGDFLESAFSGVDVIVYLYQCELRISWQTLHDTAREYFFLSKRHAIPALYRMFVELSSASPADIDTTIHDLDGPTYWFSASAVVLAAGGRAAEGV
jgi:transketolase N-terminal domain/subunit